MKFLVTLGVWVFITFTIAGAIQFIAYLMVHNTNYLGIMTLSAIVSLLITVNTEIKLNKN